MKIITREPALTAAAFSAIVNLVVAFGADLTADQVTSLNVALVAVLGVLVRQRVTPVAREARRSV